MESERRIHEDIANKHGGNHAATRPQVPIDLKNTASEFGDNVELF